MLGSKTECRTENQRRAAQRILYYPKATRSLKLVLKPVADDQLRVHADANWGAEIGTGRRSLSGILIMYVIAPIYVTSYQHKSISVSSTEAKYTALFEAGKTIMWFQHVSEEIGVKEQPTSVFQDNTDCTEQAEGGPTKHFERQKHVDIQHHYVMKLAQEKQIYLVTVITADYVGQFFDKAIATSSIFSVDC